RDEQRALRRIHASQLERRVVAEYRRLELAERASRLDAELLDEGAPSPSVRSERVGLPTASIQREHQLGVQPLPQRVLGGESFELADDEGGSAECKIGVESLLQRDGAEL